MHIIILGPPGSGKGTQSKFICERYNMTHLSTGDLFRQNLKDGTELGQKAQAFMDKGEYVPDEVVNGMVEDFLSKNTNVLLDGFPRTEPQAAELDKMLERLKHHVTCVLFIDVSDDEVVQRIVKRGKTSGRSDDNEETARKRLQVYYDQTHMLVDHYKNTSTLIHVDGFQTIEEVTSDIFEKLDPLKGQD